MKFEGLRKLILDKEVEVTSRLHGHTHRPPNRFKKLYFKIHEEKWIDGEHQMGW